MGSFTPADESLFFSKNDPSDIRLGEIFKKAGPEDLNTSDSFALLGYPDDEGIALNGGRPGASLGPDQIRQSLYKMTPSQPPQTTFVDIGNLLPQGRDLATRHSLAQECVFQLHARKIKTLSLGGGHDYGYADTSGFLKACAGDQRPLILNFDAHLDVRPVTNGFNSGTPFFRLLSDPEFSNTFDFAEIGIQPQCNSLHHRQWAIAHQAHIIDLREVQKSGLQSLFRHSAFSRLTQRTPVFVSFDIDALTSSEAGGCSQSWVTGLKTEDFLHFFATLCQNADVRGLGIYEVSPPLDTDHRTSKAAALIAYNFLFQEKS